MATLLRTIGNYEILKKLGRGGMADVYLAYDRQAERRVALKLIEFSADPDIQESIEAERRGALLQSRLCEVDPAVARIHSYGELDGHFYVDMEYVEGQDLAELLRGRPMPPDRAISIAISVCDALHQAHSFVTVVDDKQVLGIVHGDIKPKNIRIDNTGKLRLLDFGIAKGLSHSRKLTRNEYGSVPYASPERLETGVVTHATDLWSLGVILYEMVSGCQPYEASTTRRLEDIIRSRRPPKTPPPDCPEALRRIITKALAPQESLRYRSAEEFKHDLESFLAGEPTLAESETEAVEATRRTWSPEVEATRRTIPFPQEATRRTVPEQEPAETQITDELEVPRKRGPVRVFLIGLAAMMIAAILITFTHEAIVWADANKVKQELNSPRPDVNRVWGLYQALKSRSFSSLSTLPLRQSLKRALMNEAEIVISNYRNDTTNMTKADWKRAQDDLYKAVNLDPDDKEAQAKYFYATGHVQRLNKKYGEAERAFAKAAELMPNWPDPHLGLASSYVYGTKDLDKGAAALKKSEELGSTPGNRERAQMADAYRLRGGQLLKQSDQVAGLPQEKEYLLRSKQAYLQALELYNSISPFGQSTANIKAVQENLEEIELRLSDLRELELQENQKPQTPPEKPKS
ncbi:MAG TPA: protein kinase [Acidobacteriota bacterium]|jgi:serine/threonine protein kinase